MLELKLVYRHTGGLENRNQHIVQQINVHRHTGGLENRNKSNKEVLLSDCSPPVNLPFLIDLTDPLTSRAIDSIVTVLFKYMSQPPGGSR